MADYIALLCLATLGFYPILRIVLNLALDAPIQVAFTIDLCASTS